MSTPKAGETYSCSAFNTLTHEKPKKFQNRLVITTDFKATKKVVYFKYKLS